MAPSTRTTRRGLLRALGGAGAGGVATGTVVAGGGRGRGHRRGRGDGPGCDRGGGRGGGRETYSDNGIVVQFEDCRTAHVRGSKNRIDEVEVLFMVCFGGGGPCPDGDRVSITDDPPLTIDGDTYLPIPSTVDYRISVVTYRMTDGRTGGFSQPWDCPLEK